MVNRIFIQPYGIRIAHFSFRGERIVCHFLFYHWIECQGQGKAHYCSSTNIQILMPNTP
jgi:hypothetical protein